MKKKELEKALQKGLKNDPVPDVWEKISAAEIPTVAPVEKKNRNFNPFMRIASTAACFLFVCLLGIVAFTHFRQEEPMYPGIVFGQDTPVRLGQEGTVFADYMYSGDYESLCSNSDVIVEVVIKEWLGEDLEGSPKTFFHAVVINSFKGNLTEEDEIIIRQNGNSRETFEDMPLFQNGNQMILFLKKGSMSMYYENDSRDMYYLLCDSLSILDVATVDNVKYLNKRVRPFYEDEVSALQIQNNALKNKIKTKLIDKDSLIQESSDLTDFLPYDSFVEKLEGSVEGNA